MLYAVATLTDQVIQEMERNTLLYGFVLGGGILISSAVCIFFALRKRVEVSDEPPTPEEKNRRKNIAFFLTWTFIFIILLDLLGYFITTPVLLFVLFRWMGVKELWKCTLLSLSMLAVVHFLFYTWAGLQLPVGIMDTLLR